MPNFGFHHSKETREKMRASRIDKSKTEVWKMKIGASLKGKPKSIEHRKKLSESHKGKTFSEETCKKLSDSHKGLFGYWTSVTGKNHPSWKGGISFEPYPQDWRETLRRSIRERDNYTCQTCQEYGKDIHHIDYNKKNCDPNNLITLCRKCHIKTNHNRDYWNRHFTKN